MTSRRERARRYIGAALAGAVAGTAVLGPAPPGAADPRADAERLHRQAVRASSVLEGATARAQAAFQQLGAAEAALPGARMKVASARGVVAGASAKAATARRRAADAAAKVAAAEQRYALRQAEVEAARAKSSEMISLTYRGAGLVRFNALLDATSPQDLSVRSGYADRIVAEQHAAVQRLLGMRMRARQAANGAELLRRVAVTARRQADAALAVARAAEAAAESAAAAVAVLVRRRTAALAVARQERRASLARYAAVRAEEARIAAQLRGWRGGPRLQVGGRLMMPVAGWKSSDFGMRYDPYFRVWQLHAGVDLAAGGGAPIAAAATGQVIRAGWNGGYGNFTCIGHGSRGGRYVSTCYGHQSQILVSAGRWVRAGQLIGRVGTTGASTGNHLHFEVRLDGQPVDPLGYLPGCLC
ncbi:hypothetical protein GCM10010124_05380 [Pilimelia terevasa]|uniref:M23ase beta-sheet core domain-containing protein n=1 Tax=Pilimelia terevasa TaxID=53372 RepID=A0A8J3BEJ0_9ACTN|nr:M23 family metallopeptidase [Pilimelia terevasa]GGK15570.1 hypothetical protein GCM10010124_05380 [Pilimelia terevasa]